MTSSDDTNVDQFISSEACRVVETIFYVVINGVISVVGTVTNVINIVVFVKQGFSDSVNISLCGLAVADLGCLLTLMWRSICFNPLFIYSDINFDFVQTQISTAGSTHRSSVSSATWITAFITFERCVCIALPLKVRSIITPTATFIIIAGIFVAVVSIILPLFFLIEFIPLFEIKRNKTLIQVSFSENGLKYETVHVSLTFISQISSMCCVLICTVILIVNLIAKSRWRSKVTAVVSSSNADSLSLRDTRVMKMIASISSIFIICYLPVAVNAVMMVQFSPDYSNNGRLQNIYHVTWSVLNMFEAFNSTITIIIYYNMSSRYRTCFNAVFAADACQRKRK